MSTCGRSACGSCGRESASSLSNRPCSTTRCTTTFWPAGLEASQTEVYQAAKRARAHRFISEKLTDGYQTIVGSGGNRLSGGQRQRVALARAILRDPEILILDEATSQIDLESEQLIHQALEEFARDRTVFIITHRMVTLSMADRILVMDGGRVVDLGNTRRSDPPLPALRTTLLAAVSAECLSRLRCSLVCPLLATLARQQGCLRGAAWSPEPTFTPFVHPACGIMHID